MYSPEQINDLTDEQAREEFTRLAADLYGNDWRKGFSRDTGLAERTAYLYSHDKRPPLWAFTMMQNALERRVFVTTFQGLAQAIEIAKKM